MPTISIFLAQIIGVYMLIIGVSVFLRRNELEKSFKKMVSEGSFTYSLGAMVLFLGLFLVQIHNVWDGSWRVALTAFAWLALLKGATILLLPSKTSAQLVKTLAKPGLLKAMAMLSIIYGASVAGFGFGLFP